MEVINFFFQVILNRDCFAYLFIFIGKFLMENLGKTRFQKQSFTYSDFSRINFFCG